MNWPVILPAGLGFATVFLLLPRPKPNSLAFGLTCALATIVALASYLVGSFGTPQVITVEALCFYTFAGLATLFALLMVTQRKPARAALCFAVVILNTCGLFLLQAAPFLMAATIIVYAGAIVVTFLFVIMLSQQSNNAHSDANDRSREPFLASLASFLLLAILFVVLQRAYKPNDFDTLIANADRAAKASSTAEIDAIIGEPSDYFRRVDESLRPFQPDPAVRTKDPHRLLVIEQLAQLSSAIDEGASTLMTPDVKLETVQGVYRSIALRGQRLSAVASDPATVAKDLKLSNHSRAFAIDESGVLVKSPHLPAANVSAIGRSLFTDHLLAIELGGTLLLVATIGAILIGAPRNTVPEKKV